MNRGAGGRVRHAWSATTSASAAAALPKIANAGRSPSEPATTPPAMAGSESAA
jgi:hypothetical protein